MRTNSVARSQCNEFNNTGVHNMRGCGQSLHKLTVW